jgi:hypothetical protein
MDVKVSTWLPLPDILICADFFKKSATISMRDASIEMSIPEDDPVEFVAKSIAIIDKIEKIAGNVFIDYSKDKDKDKAKEIRNAIESLLL